MHDRLATAEHPVSIELSDVTLEGSLGLPAAAKGAVIFAHGSGSSRLSPRNRMWRISYVNGDWGLCSSIC